MDAFSLIQHFFTQLHCQYCNHAFAQGDIELLRREEGVYVVNVFCHQCNTQNGIALVGLESSSLEASGAEDMAAGDTLEVDTTDLTLEELVALHQEGMLVNTKAAVRHKYNFADPELTEQELERLADFPPISSDDVLDAHHFFQELDSNWMKLIPEEMRQSQTAPHTESPDD